MMGVVCPPVEKFTARAGGYMSKIKATVGAAIATVAVAGMVTIAPPASAALCGYPPVECAVGSTNPPEEQPIGATPAARAQAGMTLPDESTAKDTPPTKTPEPAVNAIGESPKVPASRGDVVKLKPVVKPAITYRVLVKRNSGPYNFIGTVTADANGNVTLPAVQFDRNGTYTFALQDGAGNTNYVRVEVG